MLIPRLLAALFLIPLVIIVLFFVPLPYFVMVMIALCGLAAWEWGQFIGLKTLNARRVFALIWVIVLTCICYLPSLQLVHEIFQFSLLLSVGWWITALLLVITYPRSTALWAHSTLIKYLFAVFTLLPFFVGMVTLRQYNYAYNAYTGATLLLYLMVLVWATDSGAYFAGRLLGKHKLAPKVSPGKTLEGFFGGVITALIIAWLVNTYYPLPMPFSTIMLASFVAILASVLGDLTESMFKREAGIKDSGHLIPGHGGILDRIDSLTSAIPIFAALVFMIL